ncbi:MAG: hypothetical protein CME71_10530 [Halobacteriovorax sp.]|nr:hypothetical protein [Halobacteriovorax sp.]|tara:strand:+ start:1540 stop:2259 length:720 start_codon:yes stop_codon:yes gene_type:complete
MVNEKILNCWKEHHFLKVPYLYLPKHVSGEELAKLQALKIDFDAKPVPLYKARYKSIEGKDVKEDRVQSDDASKNSVTYFKDELIWLDQHLAPTIDKSNSQKWKFAPLERLDPYEFVCFNEGGFIGEHSDGSVQVDEEPKKYGDVYRGRLLTQVIHMCERGVDYQGGILEIQNAFGFWLQVPLKDKGDVVYFPSVMPHRVTTIEKGRRVTLTTFLTGDYPNVVQDYFNNDFKKNLATND